MAEAEVAREKDALRAQMRAVRDAIPAAERGRLSRWVATRLLSLSPVRQAGTALLFYAFGSEVQTRGLLDALASGGRRVLLPVVEGPTMRAALYRPGDPLVEGAFGIKEPAVRTHADPTEIDVVVAPGLAFDRWGYRLGYGRGFYDRFLALVPPEVPRVGIGFHVQLVDDVPHGVADQPLSMVVTDREIVVCERG